MKRVKASDPAPPPERKKPDPPEASVPRMPSCGAGVSRRDFVKMLAAGSGVVLLHCGPAPSPPQRTTRGGYDWSKHRWGFAVDITKCIGCCACMRACRAENNVPQGYHRTWIERYRIDKKGKVKVDAATKDNHVFKPLKGEVKEAFFVPKLCNHCAETPCTQVCPVGASYRTKDGVILIDKKHCVGCGYCVQACPYNTRYMHPETHIADKCTLCYHRITKGQLPACVLACPTGARLFGDLNNPRSKISRVLERRPHRTLHPELGTKPKAFYLGLKKWVV